MFFFFSAPLQVFARMVLANIVLLLRHVMTGIGAYLYIIWGIWLRHCLNNRQEEYYLWWPHFWNFPEIIRIGSKDKGENGVAKKSN